MWRNTKVKLWTGGFTHEPSVDPPWLLKALSVLAMLSVVGTLVFTVALGTGLGSVPSLEDGIYIAVLHFILPLGVTYTITTNSPISRLLILGYFLGLYVSVVQGKGFLGNLDLDAELKAVASTAFFAAVVLWLFVAPKMRFYFALISGKSMSGDLESQAAKFMDESKLNPKVRVFIDWIVDYIETVVLVGVIVVVVFAYINMWI
ncbi:MAG: hypothetical protein OEY74_05885 [Gammaproteobacteria bacterium]|nr:hypothetical protein [Gammaproteobacteria bacterium]